MSSIRPDPAMAQCSAHSHTRSSVPLSVLAALAVFLPGAMTAQESGSDLTMDLPAADSFDVAPEDVVLLLREGASAEDVVFLAGEYLGGHYDFRIDAGNEDRAFTIDSGSGEVRVSSNWSIDFERRSVYVLTVSADVLPGNPDPWRAEFTASLLESGVRPDLVDRAFTRRVSMQIVVQVEDINEAPAMETLVLTVSEDTAAGAAMGQIQADDPDLHDALQYRIVSDDAGGIIQIDPQTGEFRLQDGAALDFESLPRIDLLVEATDRGGLSTTSCVSLVILNVNEPPQFVAAPDVQIDRQHQQSRELLTLTATDPEGSTVEYALRDDPTQGAFSIDAVSGRLTLIHPDRLNSWRDDSCTLLISATDIHGHQSRLELPVSTDPKTPVADVASVTAGIERNVAEPYPYGLAIAAITSWAIAIVLIRKRQTLIEDARSCRLEERLRMGPSPAVGGQAARATPEQNLGVSQAAQNEEDAVCPDPVEEFDGEPEPEPEYAPIRGHGHTEPSGEGQDTARGVNKVVGSSKTTVPLTLTEGILEELFDDIPSPSTAAAQDDRDDDSSATAETTPGHTAELPLHHHDSSDCVSRAADTDHRPDAVDRTSRNEVEMTHARPLGSDSRPSPWRDLVARSSSSMPDSSVAEGHGDTDNTGDHTLESAEALRKLLTGASPEVQASFAKEAMELTDDELADCVQQLLNRTDGSPLDPGFRLNADSLSDVDPEGEYVITDPEEPMSHTRTMDDSHSVSEAIAGNGFGFANSDDDGSALTQPVEHGPGLEEEHSSDAAIRDYVSLLFSRTESAAPKPGAASRASVTSSSSTRSFLDEYMQGMHRTESTVPAPEVVAEVTVPRTPKAPREKLDREFLRSSTDSFRQVASRATDQAIKHSTIQKERGQLRSREYLLGVMIAVCLFVMTASLMRLIDFGRFGQLLSIAIVLCAIELLLRMRRIRINADRLLEERRNNGKRNRGGSTTLQAGEHQTAPLTANGGTRDGDVK